MKFEQVSKAEMTRRVIQHEFLRLLNEEGFSFEANTKEPHGIQRRVIEAVNRQRYDDSRLKTNKQQVSN